MAKTAAEQRREKLNLLKEKKGDDITNGEISSHQGLADMKEINPEAVGNSSVRHADESIIAPNVNVEKPSIDQQKGDEKVVVFNRPSTIGGEVPAKFRRVLTKEDDPFMTGSVQISKDILSEFGLLRRYIEKRGLKTSANGMMNNILREWLVRNGEDLQEHFHYKPYSHG